MNTQHMKQAVITLRKGVFARPVLRWCVYNIRMLEVSTGVQTSVTSLRHNHFRM